MRLNTRFFREDPLVFLESGVIVVPGATDTTIGPGGIGAVHRFQLKEQTRNVVWLTVAAATADDREVIRAYYLPWSTKSCQSMTLGDEADFFFTSHFTDCRFTILSGSNKGAKSPIVAHTAGDSAQSNMFHKVQERDTWEAGKGVVPTPLLPQRRSFEAKEGTPQNKQMKIKHYQTREDTTFAARPARHNYSGGTTSSAFVFGRRIGGFWQFYAQVTEGCRVQAGGVPVTEDLKILKWCDKNTIDLMSLPTW